MENDFKYSTDLEIDLGDFVLADSDQQSVQDIINAYKGNYKEFPLIGVGIDTYKHSTPDASELQSIVKKQLEADGFTVNSVTIIDKQIYVDAIKA